MNTVDDCFCLFDDDDGRVILLSDYRRTIFLDENGGEFQLSSVFAAIEGASANGEWIALAADYALGACFEPSVEQPEAERPPLRGWVFGKATSLAPSEVNAFLERKLSELPEQERVAGVAELIPSLDAQSYAASVEQVLRWIADGECYQINLTFPLDFRLYGHPLALYAQLRERQPVRYGAFIAGLEETIVSCSPELFFERTGDRVVTRPMKGTAPRGATPEEDDARRCALLASEKERAENVMIVDLLRNDLGRLAAPGKVRVDALCQAEAYPTLWQVVSTVSADLPGVRLIDLFRALFPCGSITGAPKVATMQKIARLEKSPRGIYTGALGWVAPNGDCRFNVAIRTLEQTGGGHVRLGVGSGIVIDSDPAREYAECLLKARFLTGFDPGFELIETMRLEDGEFPLLAHHLERLGASAKALGFSCNLAEIYEVLARLAVAEAKGIYRVRMTLAHDGQWKMTSALLPAGEEPTRYLVIADEVLDAEDYLLRHKTTARDRYDRSLAALADQPDVFDALFFNTRGELCEGARSNVFIERDGKLLTPPLACGLLPGVMLRHLLESGRAVECVLTRDDLVSAPAIYVANALRGLMRVVLRV